MVKVDGNGKTWGEVGGALKGPECLSTEYNPFPKLMGTAYFLAWELSGGLDSGLPPNTKMTH